MTVVRSRPRRAGDVVFAGAAAVALSPVLAVLAGLVRWRLGSPVLFRQERAGHRGRPFTILKLRTMTDERDETGALLPDEQRLTGLGRVLRQTSLDELPELWNVIRGDMALVGPRPLPVGYLDRYTPTEARRHEILPGLTGWAQVNGRNATSWEERLAMDVWYVDNRSLGLDLRVLARTLAVVLRRVGVNAEGHVTMPDLRPPDTTSS
jgi:lipopolysaccharide/colanic/teichoic acid biosynthesis glycosyltransferase